MHLRPHRIGPVLLAALVLSASKTGAEELSFGVWARTIWEERNASTGGSTDRDGLSFRGAPRIEARDNDGDFTWKLGYEPKYEYYIEDSSLSGWDHDVFASGEWRIGPTTSVSASNRFSRYENQARFNETLVEEGTSFVVERVEERPLTRNVANVTVTHQLAAHHQVSLSGSHVLHDQSGEGVDRSNVGLVAQYLYTLNPRNTIGVAGSWQRQTFDEFDEVPERNTDYYNVSLRWIYSFDPTLVLNFSAGPTWIESDSGREVPQSFTGPRLPVIGGGFVDVSTCPTVDGMPVLGAGCQALNPRRDGEPPITNPDVVLALPEVELVTVDLLEDPPSSADGRLTYFADVSLIKSWEQWQALIGYQRRDDTTSGLGVSTLADIARVSVSYRPSARWTFMLNGSYVRQTQSQDSFVLATALQGTTLMLQPFLFGVIPTVGMVTLRNVGEIVGVRAVEVDADLRIDTWVAAFQARYRLTKRLTLVGEMFYLEESQEGDLRTRRELERYRAAVGFLYEFDPIRF